MDKINAIQRYCQFELEVNAWRLDSPAEQLRHVREEIVRLETQLINDREASRTCPPVDDWFWELALEYDKENIAAMNQWLNKLARKWHPRSKDDRSAIDIAAIKENILIADIMPTAPSQKATNRLYYKAPWRDEKQASLVVYIDKNRWYDFGECCGGDVIDLYMKLNDLTFKEAIRELSQ